MSDGPVAGNAEFPVLNCGCDDPGCVDGVGRVVTDVLGLGLGDGVLVEDGVGDEDWPGVTDGETDAEGLVDIVGDFSVFVDVRLCKKNIAPKAIISRMIKPTIKGATDLP